MRNACKKAVLSLMQRDRDVMLLTADGHDFVHELPPGTEKQFVDFGIAEQSMVASAAGLASCGKKPILFAVTNFMAYRAFEFIRDLACIPQYPLIFVGFFSGLTRGPWGITHHGTEDLAILRTLPNLTVITPASPREAEAALHWAYESGQAAYIRIEAGHEQELLPENYVFAPGQATVLRDGEDAALIAQGSIIGEAVVAAGILAKEGVGLRVINMPTVRPLDEKIILAVAKETGYLLTLEEGTVYGGLGSAVAELLAENGIASRFVRMGLQGFAAGCGTQRELREQYGLTAPHINRKIKRLLYPGGGQAS